MKSFSEEHFAELKTKRMLAQARFVWFCISKRLNYSFHLASLWLTLSVNVKVVSRIPRAQACKFPISVLNQLRQISDQERWWCHLKIRVSPSAKWNKSSLKRSVPAKWLKDVWQSPAAAPAFPWWPPKVRQGKYLLSLQHAPLRKSEERSSGIPNTPKKLADLLAPQGKDLDFAILIRVEH